MEMNTNAIQIFNFNSNTIRVIERDGDPWWVAKDICAILDLDLTSGARGLDDDEKGLHLIQTPGGIQSMAIINESVLYSLIFRSRKPRHAALKPEAKAFKRWITHEVIPAIRKHNRHYRAIKLRRLDSTAPAQLS